MINDRYTGIQFDLEDLRLLNIALLDTLGTRVIYDKDKKYQSFEFSCDNFYQVQDIVKALYQWTRKEVRLGNYYRKELDNVYESYQRFGKCLDYISFNSFEDRWELDNE